MAPRRAGTHSSGRAFDLVRHLVTLHPDWTPKQVYKEVSRELDGTDDHISETTSWRMYRELHREDLTGPWTPATAEPADMPLVLEVVRAASAESGIGDLWKKPWWPSQAVAEWIIRIRKAYPDLEDGALLLYLAHTARRDEQSQREVGEVLAWTPWRDEGRALIEAVVSGAATYRAAVLAGKQADVEVAIQTARHPKLGRKLGKETGE